MAVGSLWFWRRLGFGGGGGSGEQGFGFWACGYVFFFVWFLVRIRSDLSFLSQNRVLA